MSTSNIKKILLISLTNIGDVILTFPVVDILCRDFPQAELSVVVGPKAAPLLQGNPRIKNVLVFDKHQSGLKKFFWVWGLRKCRFDLVVDLRNTAIPFLLSPKYRTRPAGSVPQGRHMKDKHLDRLRTVHPFDGESADRVALFLSDKEKSSFQKLLGDRLRPGERFVVVAPGSADSAKRWPPEKFAGLCRKIQETYPVKIVLVGDENDEPVAEEIAATVAPGVINLCGRTDLKALAEILSQSMLVVVNDSGIMHLAAYLDRPVTALFGPTDPVLYGPWGRGSSFIRKGTDVSAITVEDVFKEVAKVAEVT